VYGFQNNQLARSLQRYRNKIALLTKLATFTDFAVHEEDMTQNGSNYPFHRWRRYFEIYAMAELLARSIELSIRIKKSKQMSTVRVLYGLFVQHSTMYAKPFRPS
jgi:hypothetical protein